MKFTKDFTTTWHDTDADRRVRLSRLLVYMQEALIAHFASLGFDLDRLRDEKGVTFMLSKLQLSVFLPLYAYQKITVETWTSESKGFSFVRSYRILRDGETVAEAYTVWALLSVSNRSLCPVDFVDFKFNHNEPLVPAFPICFHIPKAEELSLLGERKIVYSDLDYNMHMNNTKYADMLCDFLPYHKISGIKSITLSYLHESAFGDTLKIYCTSDSIKTHFRTVNQNGDVCLEAQIIY